MSYLSGDTSGIWGFIYNTPTRWINYGMNTRSEPWPRTWQAPHPDTDDPRSIVTPRDPDT
jgi:hypothetical protein